MSSFLSLKELSQLGLKSCGKNVLISRFSNIYHPENIRIGNNVRIDDFCVISAKGSINIGNHVHVASHVGIWGHNGVDLCDFSGISSGTKIYSESDDFSGKSLTGPTIPDKYKIKSVNKRNIRIGRHVVIGANSTVLPGVYVNDGSTVGCNSVINKDCAEWKIYAGAPIKYICDRSKDLLELEKKLPHKKE